MRRFLFVILLLLMSCAKQEKITGRDIIYLNTADVSNFIKLIPDVMAYSAEYQKGLNEAQKKDPNYNEKYFQSVKQNKKMRKEVAKAGFHSTDDFLDVYIAVFLGLRVAGLDKEAYQKALMEQKKKILRLNDEINAFEKIPQSDPSEQSLLTLKKKLLSNHKKMEANIVLLRRLKPAIDKALGVSHE